MKYFFICCFSFLGLHLAAQQNDVSQPPYRRFPTLPPVQLLMSDSTTLFTKADFKKGEPLLLILFSPECEHCQHEAEELVKYKDSLKNIQIVMATMFPLWKMKEFATKYKLDQMPNV